MWAFSGLKNSKGFSLIELMIVLAIMMIISLTVAQIMVNTALQKRSLEVMQAGRDFHDEITQIVGGDKCGLSKITGIDTATLYFDGTSTDDVLVKRADSDFIDNGLETDGSTPPIKNTFDIELKGIGLWKAGVKKGDNYDNLKIQITSIQLVPFKTTNKSSTSPASYAPVDSKIAKTASFYKAQIEIKYKGTIGGRESVERTSRHPVILTMTRETEDDITTDAYISDCGSLEKIRHAKTVCESMKNSDWDDEELKCYICQYGRDESSTTTANKCNEQQDSVSNKRDATTSNWLDMNNAGNAPDNYQN